MGTECLQPNDVGAHVHLADLREVPLRGEHAQPLGRASAPTGAQPLAVGVERHGGADAVGPARAVRTADSRNADRLAGLGREPLGQVPVAQAGEAGVERPGPVDQGAAVGHGVDVGEVGGGEEVDVVPIVADGWHDAGGSLDELGGQGPRRVGVAGECVDHAGEVGGVERVVRVEVGDDLTPGLCQRPVAGGRRPVLLGPQDAHPVVALPAGEGLGVDVAATVVDDDHLPPRVGLRPHAGQGPLELAGPVVQRAHDGDERAVGRRLGRVDPRDLVDERGQRAGHGECVGPLAVEPRHDLIQPGGRCLEAPLGAGAALDCVGGSALLRAVEVEHPVIDLVEPRRDRRQHLRDRCGRAPPGRAPQPIPTHYVWLLRPQTTRPGATLARRR
ncbi:MAG TPA: hypothetical protein VFZ68_15690 [Acidimicrobiales bacterium]